MNELFFIIPFIVFVFLFIIFGVKAHIKRLTEVPRKLSEHFGLKMHLWTSMPKKYNKYPFYEGKFQGLPFAIYVTHAFRYYMRGRGRQTKARAYIRLILSLPKLNKLGFEVRFPPDEMLFRNADTLPIDKLFYGKNLDKIPSDIEKMLRDYAKEYKTFYLLDRENIGKLIVPSEVLKDENVIFVNDILGLSLNFEKYEKRIEIMKETLEKISNYLSTQ